MTGFLCMAAVVGNDKQACVKACFFWLKNEKEQKHSENQKPIYCGRYGAADRLFYII